MRYARALAALTLTLAAAGTAAALAPTATSAAAPATRTADDATQRDSDALHPSWCSDGVATLAVNYAKDGTTGHIQSIRAVNGTGRRVTFDDIYASSGHHRFETYGAILGAYLTPGQDLYAGGGGPNHRLPFYVVGQFHASTNPDCTGTISVALTPGLARGKHPGTVNASVTWDRPTRPAPAAL